MRKGGPFGDSRTRSRSLRRRHGRTQQRESVRRPLSRIPPLRFKVEYDPVDQLYDLDGEFGISVSANSRSDLYQELQEALSMLWIEYGEESPDRLSPKARQLRNELRKRLTAA